MTRPSSRFLNELSFYASFHHHPVNQAIHAVCIPLIFLTALILLSHPALVLPLGVVKLMPAPAVAAWYCAYYLMIGAPLGLALTAVGLVCAACWGAIVLTATYGRAALLTALAVHIAAWVAQFVGHGVWEKRAPALLTNLQQALVLAPLFAVVEVGYAVGLLRGLQTDVRPLVRARLAAFKYS